MNLRRVIPALTLAVLALTACSDDGPKASTDPTPHPMSASSSPSESVKPTPSKSATSQAPTQSAPATSAPAPEPTETPTTPSEPTGSEPLESDFPLTNGWPTAAEIGSDGTLEAPSEDADPLILTACDLTFALDMPGAITARMEAPEDFRARAYGTYPNESESRAALSILERQFPTCKESAQEPGWTNKVEGDAYSAGGLRILQAFKGTSAVGVSSTVVFMRGTTMVISTQGNEGVGFAQARQQAEEQAQQLAPVLHQLAR